jgi:hypothetical protein
LRHVGRGGEEDIDTGVDHEPVAGRVRRLPDLPEPGGLIVGVAKRAGVVIGVLEI